MEKLDKAHIMYAAKEAYTSNDMYRRILTRGSVSFPKTARDPTRSIAMASVVAIISR